MSVTSAMALRLSTALLVTVILSSETHGHSYLVDPPADWRTHNHAHCRRGGPKEYPNDTCSGPCIAPDSWFLSRYIPTTVWTRGSTARAAWNQNKHENGFMRLSVVKPEFRMNFTAHSMGVFYIGCYSAEKAECEEVCGTGDFDYEATFRVPPLPDGDYILGWAWFGGYGGKHGKDMYRFGDYYSCARIKIQGDEAPLPNSDVFAPNGAVNLPPVGSDRCRAATDRLGVCEVEPCPEQSNEPQWMCPSGTVLFGGRCLPRGSRRSNASVTATATPRPAEEAGVSTTTPTPANANPSVSVRVTPTPVSVKSEESVRVTPTPQRARTSTDAGATRAPLSAKPSASASVRATPALAPVRASPGPGIRVTPIPIWTRTSTGLGITPSPMRTRTSSNVRVTPTSSASVRADVRATPTPGASGDAALMPLPTMTPLPSVL